MDQNTIWITLFFLLAIILFAIYKYSGKTDRNGKYLYENDWRDIINPSRYFKNDHVDGVEIVDLPSTHLLAGQKGLFATRDFHQYDILGEYTGRIVKYDDVDNSNLYIFTLVDDIIVDADTYGNELKYVNSHINIADAPNLTSNQCYIDGKPKVLFICNRDIAAGEELLLDYGDAYNEAHILLGGTHGSP